MKDDFPEETNPTIFPPTFCLLSNFSQSFSIHVSPDFQSSPNKWGNRVSSSTLYITVNVTNCHWSSLATVSVGVGCETVTCWQLMRHLTQLEVQLKVSAVDSDIEDDELFTRRRTSEKRRCLQTTRTLVLQDTATTGTSSHNVAQLFSRTRDTRTSPWMEQLIPPQRSFRKTGTIRMLASQGDIGVWCQATGALPQGYRGMTPETLWDCTCKILQPSVQFLARKWFTMPSTMHS